MKRPARRGHEPTPQPVLLAIEIVLAITLVMSLVNVTLDIEPYWLFSAITSAIGIGFIEMFRLGARSLASRTAYTAERREEQPTRAEEAPAKASVEAEAKVAGPAPAQAEPAEPADTDETPVIVVEQTATEAVAADDPVQAGEPVLPSADASDAARDEEAKSHKPETIPTSTLDFQELTRRLLETHNPIEELRLFVGDIRTREAAVAEAEGKDTGDAKEPTEANQDAGPSQPAKSTGKTSKLQAQPQSPSAAIEAAVASDSDASLANAVIAHTTGESDRPLERPSDLEEFAARMLTEAGIFQTDVDLPSFKVVSLGRSKLFYLRPYSGSSSMAYLARLRLLKVEATLNQIRFAAEHLPQDASIEDCYDVNQLVLHHICSQVGAIDTPYELEEGDLPDTEWTVRRQIATVVESLVLPYRLELDYRVNVADHNVSIVFKATPEQVFPSSMLVGDLGIVTSSREMRKKAASAYAQRLAILLAGIAFRTSKKILHVWVAATVDTANHHWCYLSVDFDRWRFSQLDLENDLVDASNFDRVYHRFVPARRVENGMLRPVAQTFELSEERFCPPRRHEVVSLSSRRIPQKQAEVLGSPRVSGLSIEESDKRNYLANDIMRRLIPSEFGEDAQGVGPTQRNVRMIMDLAGDDPDPSVRAAAERTIKGLIDGQIPDDPAAVGKAFAEGDGLSQAAERAHGLFEHQDVQKAASILRRALDHVDSRGIYEDTVNVEWRYFSSYVDRVLYNRLYRAPETSVLLVPDAYFECHLMLSAAYSALGQHADALRHARRILELAPVDRRARLHYVRSLEQNGQMDEAVEELKRLLRIAHDPEGLGVGYYRMAFFQWQRGNILAAQACYLSSLAITRGSFPMAAMELSALAMQNPGSYHENMDQDEIVKVLTDASIPIAPTEEITRIFLSCMRASVDAEVFPVARSFVSTLAGLYPDDVVIDILKSLESEPDQ